MDDKTRIRQLEDALIKMHDTVHKGVYRIGGHKNIPGSQVVDGSVFFHINRIMRETLGADHPSMRYYGPAQPVAETV